MTEKQGGSDVRANTTRALAGRRRLVGAHRPQVVLQRADVRPLPRPRADRRRRHLLRAAARAARRRAQRRLPAPAPQGQARQPLQRLERGRVPRRAGAQMVGEPGPRRADDHRDGQPHAPGLRHRHGGRDARGGRAGDLARRAPQRLRQAPGRAAADASTCSPTSRSSPRRRPRVALRLARAYDEAPDDPSADAFKRLATAVAKYYVCKRAPGPRLRGARVPGRQRLRRGVRDAAPVPRGAAGLDLGGLGQRHGPRRPARAGAQPRGARRLLRRGRRGRGRRPAPRRLRRRHARGVHRPRGASSRARGGWSSAWRCACRARCSCATRRPRWPTPSAPRAWPATRACTTARCRPASTPRRSSRGTRRRCDRSAEIVRPPAGGPASAPDARRRRCRARWPPSAPLRA